MCTKKFILGKADGSEMNSQTTQGLFFTVLVTTVVLGHETKYGYNSPTYDSGRQILEMINKTEQL